MMSRNSTGNGAQTALRGLHSKRNAEQQRERDQGQHLHLHDRAEDVPWKCDIDDPHDHGQSAIPAERSALFNSDRLRTE